MSETHQQPTIAARMAGFALSLKYSDIPEDVKDHGRLLLKDTFGVAMSCQDLPHAQAVRSAIEDLGTSGKVTLWGREEKAGLADAVLYDAALIHGADYDDTHVASIIHPSAAVVSTAVCVGELTGASTRDIFTAIVAGWEIIIRLGLAAKGRFHDVGFHGTGIAAPFASACVAARLLGDSQETLENALGICGSQSAAIQEFLHDGSWVKKIHPGWGAHSAMYALSMARAGFIGPKQVFEGGFGMWMTHCGGTDGLEEAFADLGSCWHTTGITVKLYPVCHMTHSFIDCMFAMMDKHGFTPDDIEHAECRIENRCYSIVCSPREAKIRPNTEYMMRFSLPYVVAAAAVRGRVTPAEIDTRLAADPQLCGLMDRIDCISDDSKANPGYFPGYLTVTLKDGRTYTEDQRYEMGTPQNPLNIKAVTRKFRDNLSGLYTDEQIDTMSGMIDRFEELSSISEFISALRR